MWILVHPDAPHEVDGRAESDRLDDRRRAGLELGGHGRRCVAVDAHVGDHVAAAEERRRGIEQLAAAPQRPDTGRPAHLVAGEGDEVGVPNLHVGDVVGHELAGVDHRQRTGGVSGRAQLGDGRERAEHVAHGTERQHLGAVEQRVELAEVTRTGRPRRAGSSALDAGPLGDDVPGTMLAWCSNSVSTTTSPGRR